MRRPAQAVLVLWLALLGAGCDDSGQASECVYNSDCADDELCADGTCRAECQADRDCADGEVCADGVCENAGRRDLTDGGTGTDSDGDLSPGDATAGLDGSPRDLGPRPVGEGSIQGVVHFRLHDDSVLPVAEPIVYWTYPENPPDPLNGQASCDCGFPAYAVTGNPDGTFLLEDVPAGQINLVVQKGHFRRQRLVEVPVDGLLNTTMDVTELPVRANPESGDEIPHIVVGTGRFDSIEDVFGKLRLGPLTSDFHFDYDAYMADPDAWGVDLMLYQQPRVLDDNDEALVAPDFLDLLSDGDAMQDYHLIMAPCAEVSRYGSLLTSERNRTNISQFVAAGGKLYVTDYAYDVLEQPFPHFVDFRGPDGDGNADGHIGDPSFMGIATHDTRRYASHNRAIDPVLASWLITVNASTDGTLMTEGNWVNINRVDAVEQCCNADGATVSVVPQVVMNGPNFVERTFGEDGPSHDNWTAAANDSANRPHTVRFPVECGEVMYSTYHTVEGQVRTAGLAAQELVLVHLILEIGECNPDPIKEPLPED